jgi:hypothetical protein
MHGWLKPAAALVGNLKQRRGPTRYGGVEEREGSARTSGGEGRAGHRVDIDPCLHGVAPLSLPPMLHRYSKGVMYPYPILVRYTNMCTRIHHFSGFSFEKVCIFVSDTYCIRYPDLYSCNIGCPHPH